jgi:hypothetical protein
VIYYTYIYLRTNGTPYYVGKGSGKRAFLKRKKCYAQPPKNKKNIEIIPCLNEQQAFDLEKLLISLWGRKRYDQNGVLNNNTLGGEGVSGHRPTKLTIQKRSLQISKSLKGKPQPKWSIERKINHSKILKNNINIINAAKIRAKKHKKPIFGTNIVTKEIKYFHSAEDAKIEGFLSQHIRECCSGKRKSHKNFIWKFVNV